MLKRSVCAIFMLMIWCASASSQGLRLFSPEIKEAAPKTQVVVMDFLERYFLQLKNPPQAKNMIRDDQFKFLTGSLETVEKLLPTRSSRRRSSG